MKIAVNTTSLPANSRAAHYGDGCFTTIAVTQGKVELLQRHIARLKGDSQAIELTLTDEELQQIETLLVRRAAEIQQGVLKVSVVAASGGRGYSRNKEGPNEVYIFDFPEVTHYQDWRRQGIRLGVAKYKTGLIPRLSGVKHLSRLEQVLVKNEATEEFDDVLVLDDQGMICETSAANIFWFNGKCWFTPELVNNGVSGVMRNYILGLMSACDIPVQTVSAHVDVLFDAKEVFICNSLMKVVPVSTFTSGDFGSVREFSDTTAFQRVKNEMEKDNQVRC